MYERSFRTVYDAFCELFPGCRGCPLEERHEYFKLYCEEYIYISQYTADAGKTIAEWLGGVGRAVSLDNPAPQRTPETRREILQAAERCVCGDRDNEYGGPENSFALIAQLWEPIIRTRCVSPGADVAVDAVTVALLMAELKIARAATNTGHMDSWVDLAGYAACGGEIAAKGGGGAGGGGGGGADADAEA